MDLGELACQSARWRLPTLHYTNARIWIWVIKNTLELSLARFNMYIMYKRVLIHWILVRRTGIHDLEQQD